jgi:pyridoxal phosphate enzyme (YggS family)
MDAVGPVEIAERYRAVQDRIAAACARAGRGAEAVTLVAVSKAQPVAAIAAAVEAGCLDFGENRVQEWRDKAQQLPRRLRWHFIGPLQRNKVKYLAGEVTLVHSVDRIELVEAFEQRAESPQDVLLEVNVGAEAQKSGVAETDLLELAARCGHSPVVRPVGLMCIPPYLDDPEGSRPYYRRLAELLAQVRRRLAEEDELLAEECRHLSMGMSHDFEVAVEEGATLVRVGTAVFGPRPAG